MTFMSTESVCKGLTTTVHVIYIKHTRVYAGVIVGQYKPSEDDRKGRVLAPI